MDTVSDNAGLKVLLAAGALIVLHKVIVQSYFPHVVLVISLHEISPAIAVDYRGDHAKDFDTVDIVLNLNLTNKLTFHSFCSVSRITLHIIS